MITQTFKVINNPTSFLKSVGSQQLYCLFILILLERVDSFVYGDLVIFLIIHLYIPPMAVTGFPNLIF